MSSVLFVFLLCTTVIVTSGCLGGDGDDGPKDGDKDGYPDTEDAFPEDPGEWNDTDSDGVGDNSDLFPNDSTESSDTDGDGVGDNSDAFPEDEEEWQDSDGDGVGDNRDAFPSNRSESVDTDGDGMGNNADKDDDNDGYDDVVEEIDGSNPLSNTSKPDFDKDGIDNKIDQDDDNDGYTDIIEFDQGTNPRDNSSTPADNDKDFLPDSMDTDDDNDGYIDVNDIFPFDGTEWVDFDEDGQGDNSDPDDDNDSVNDTTDAFPFNKFEWSDNDFDGEGDNGDSDDDNDGYNDTIEELEQTNPFDNSSTPPDNDLDYIPDSMDDDDDNDGHLDDFDAFPFDETEWVDTDHDGLGNNADLDDDNDGVDDGDDAFPYDNSEWDDTDEDGIGNNADLDDDNDGISDDLEQFKYDSDSLDASDVFTTGGMITYDKTGNTLDTDSVYLIYYSSTAYSDTIPIVVNETVPQFSNGSYTLVNSTNGKTYLHERHVSGTNLLAGEIQLQTYENVEIDVNAVSLVFDEHTYGIGMGESTDYLFISFEKHFMLFNDVHLEGTVMSLDYLIRSDIFNVEFNIELSQLLDKMEMTFLGTNLTLLLVSNVSYYDTDVISGDVIDIFTPEEIITLGINILKGDIQSNASKYIIDIAQRVDLSVLVFLDKSSTRDESTIWFIVTSRNIEPEDLSGIVDLAVYETDLTEFEIRQNLTFPSLDLFIDFRVGVHVPNSYLEDSEYTSREVRDLWGMIGENDQTIVDSVSVEGYALIVDLDTIFEKIESSFGLGERLNAIDSIVTFRNPAIGLLFDENWTDVFSVGHERVWNYTSLIFIPDFPQDEGTIHHLRFTGSLYDINHFFGFDDFNMPLIVLDIIADELYAPQNVILQSIYEDPKNVTGDNLLTKIQTTGFISGSTMKTLADVAGLLGPAAKSLAYVINKAPVDIGLYDLNRDYNDVTYHVPVIMIGNDKGPTYLGTQVMVKGYYVNLSQAEDILGNASLLSKSIRLAQALYNFVIWFLDGGTDVRTLNGFILAYSIEQYQFAPYLQIDEDRSDINPILKDNGEKLKIETKTHIDIKFGLFDSLWENSKLMLILMGPNESADPIIMYSTFFSFLGLDRSIEITLEQNHSEYGVYTIEYHLIDLKRFGKEIDNFTYTFEISNQTMTDSGDSIDIARVIEIGKVYTETLKAPSIFGGTEDEADWFNITVNTTESRIFVFYLNHHGNNFDMFLYDNNGDEITRSVWGNPYEVVSKEVTGKVTFFIRLKLPGWYSSYYGYYSIKAELEEDSSSSFNDAVELSLGDYHNETVNENSDQYDYFKVYVPSGITIIPHIEIYYSEADVDLYLYDSSENEVDRSTQSGYVNETLYWTVDTAEYYYIKVKAYDNFGPYTLYIHSEEDTGNIKSNSRNITGLSYWNESLQEKDNNDKYDWFKFYLLDDTTIYISIDVPDGNSDYDAEFYDSSNNELDDSMGWFNSDEYIMYTVSDKGNYYLRLIADDYDGIYQMTIFTEEDSGSTRATSKYLPDGSKHQELLDAFEDTDLVDIFMIYLKEDEILTATLYVASSSDADLILYDSDGESIIEASHGTGVNERIKYRASENGFYYLKVDGYSGRMRYTITVIAEKDTGDSGVSARTVNNELTWSEKLHDGIDTSDVFKTWIDENTTIINSLWLNTNADYGLFLYNDSLDLIRYSTNSGNDSEYIIWTSNESSYYYIQVYYESGDGLYYLNITTEIDSSDQIELLNNLSSNDYWYETLDEESDEDDVFIVEANTDDEIRIFLSMNEESDFDLFLYDEDLNLVDKSYNFGLGKLEWINYTVSKNQTYYIDINAWEGFGDYIVFVSIDKIGDNSSKAYKIEDNTTLVDGLTYYVDDFDVYYVDIIKNEIISILLTDINYYSDFDITIFNDTVFSNESLVTYSWSEGDRDESIDIMGYQSERLYIVVSRFDGYGPYEIEFEFG